MAGVRTFDRRAIGDQLLWLRALDTELGALVAGRSDAIVDGTVLHLYGGLEAAGIASEISERCFGALRAPVRRLGAARVPTPQARQLERLVRPRPEDVVGMAVTLMEHES